MKNKKTVILVLITICIIVLVIVLLRPDKVDESSQSVESTEVSNETLKTIFSRKSVRSYSAQKVTREQLNTLVRAAMAAPTAVNKQPWAFVIIDERAILDSLAKALPYAKMLSEASAAVVVCGDIDKALLDKEQAYWVQDCSAASQNLLLAAESLGLGAVWTGVFPREDRVELVRNVLSLPTNLIPLNVIPIGYPKNQNESPKDKYKPENIHYNRF